MPGMEPDQFGGQLPQEQAPAGAQAKDANQSAQGVEELVTNIHSDMVSLLDTLNESKVASEQDKKVLADILQQYRSFVSGSLGQKQGQGPEPVEAMGKGSVPVEYVDRGSVIPA